MRFLLHLVIFTIQFIFALAQAIVLTPITFVLLLILRYNKKD